MAEDQLTDDFDSSFFLDKFPALPELTCLSSSPSSSLSSVTCWDELKSSDVGGDHVVNNNVETFNCMDFMNTITWDDDHDIDFFYYENTSDFHEHKDQQIQVAEQQQEQEQEREQEQEQEQSTVKIKRKGSKDLAVVFLEWLKANKGLFSAEDLRKVKLKRSTIESSIQRFGGGKEGMKRLLKLILQWVQKNHIHEQGKRIRKPAEPSNLPIKQNPRAYPNFTTQSRTNDQNGLYSPSDHNPCFSISNWNIPHLTLPQPPHLSPYDAGDSTTVAAGTGLSAMDGYTSESIINFNYPYQRTCDNPLSPSQISTPSPGKEARRTRMARQKRGLLEHEHNRIENYQHAMLSGSTRETCFSSSATASEESVGDHANHVYWC